MAVGPGPFRFSPAPLPPPPSIGQGGAVWGRGGGGGGGGDISIVEKSLAAVPPRLQLFRRGVGCKGQRDALLSAKMHLDVPHMDCRVQYALQ